jgi:hypothetical protein
MLYYLEDHASSALLFIHQQPYLVNNLKSGILDCYVRTFDKSYPIIETLQNHSNVDTIFKIGPTGLIEIPITDKLRYNCNLIKIRHPAFEVLLQAAEQYRNKNSYGFYPSDPFVINLALQDANRIDEYASVMNISSEFAKQELTMIAESIQIDQFKIFTVCNLWKQRINSCEDPATIQQYIKLIKRSFASTPGIPNV